MANSRLDIIIEARDRASKEIQGVQRSLGGLQRSAAVALKAAGGIGAALAIFKAGEAVMNQGRMAAANERLETSFEQLSGSVGKSSSEMLASMRQASDGAIANSDLILGANRAILLGVADSSEDMSKLLEVASARGKAMGLSTKQAFDDLVTGIGRMSPMILDNLGIVTGGQQVFDEYAASIGRAADSLTDAEKKQALLNKVVSESSSLMAANSAAGRDNAASFERMDSSAQNLRASIDALLVAPSAAMAEWLAESNQAWADFFNSMTEAEPAPRKLAVSLTDLHTKLKITENQMAALRIAGMENTEEYQKQAASAARLQAAIDALNSATNFYENNLETTTTAVEHWGRMQDVATGSVDRTSASVLSMAGSMRTGINVAQAFIATLRGVSDEAAGVDGVIRSGAMSLAGAIGAEEALRLYEAQGQVLANNVALWKAQGLEGDELTFKAAELEQKMLDTQRALRGNTKAAAEFKAKVVEIDREMEALKSAASGVLSSSLSLDVGVDPADFMPRPDAINEDARRLADVMVNGFASPWAKYFETEFPTLFKEMTSGGDIQGAAAKILMDFQDGLRPELIDKEAAKERVRRMLTGDANLRQMANEIAEELKAELAGSGLSEAEIADAVGLSLGTGAGIGAGGAQAMAEMKGTEAATGFGDAMLSKVSNAQTGIKVVSAVLEQMEGQKDRVRAAAQKQGGAWGDGFLSSVGANVPFRLIQILTDLVTPNVEERLRSGGSRTGTVD